jgi:hypothetical protein
MLLAKRYFIFAIFLLPLLAWSQKLPEKENDTLIVWTEDRKLTWDDFQPDDFEGNKAATSDIGIDILTVSSSGGGYKHEVFSYFLKLGSSTETNDSEVLKHEQLHFDIAELYARKIRDKLKKIADRRYSIQEYHSIVDQIYQTYFETQNSYDRETKHSTDSEKQKEWNLKISRALKAMNHARSKRYK